MKYKYCDPKTADEFWEGYHPEFIQWWCSETTDKLRKDGKWSKRGDWELVRSWAYAGWLQGASRRT